MSDKVIILGWHFNTEDINFIDEQGEWVAIDKSEGEIFQFNDNGEFTIINSKFKIYLIGYKNGVFEKGDEKIVNDKINNIINDNTGKEILLLLHKTPWNSYKCESTDKLYLDIFSSGELYFIPKIKENGILVNNKNIFKKLMTELDWDFVWNKLYLLLEKKKRELIELWLPLAIDKEGESEMTEDKKAYRDEINKDYSSDFFNTLKDKHNGIIANVVDFQNLQINSKETKLNGHLPNIILFNGNDDFDFPSWLCDLNKNMEMIIESSGE